MSKLIDPQIIKPNQVSEKELRKQKDKYKNKKRTKEN